MEKVRGPKCNARCSRTAKFFGRFAGGLCEEHAVKSVCAMDDLREFWTESQDRLLPLLTADRLTPSQQ